MLSAFVLLVADHDALAVADHDAFAVADHDSFARVDLRHFGFPSLVFRSSNAFCAARLALGSASFGDEYAFESL